MDIKISLLDTLEDYFFTIRVNKRLYFSSELISELFYLNIDEYNKILAEKVVQHEDYYIEPGTKDLVFLKNRVLKETYIERFKEAFSAQFVLLTLEEEGELDDGN